MDVQPVSKAQQTSLFGNFGAPADSAAPGSAENAFSALLNLVGVKFNTGSAIGGMESKLMHSNDAAHAAQAEARDDAAKDAPRSLVKAKGTKSEDKDAKAAKDQDDTATDTATKTDDTTAPDAAADQTQAAVQAAVETTVQLPVAAEVQAAPVVAVVQQAAVAEAVTGPVEAATDTAVAAATPEIAATATVAQPEKVAEAAAVVKQAAGPAVVQTKTANTGPKLAQAAAATVAADDAAPVDETAVQEVVTASAKTAVVKEVGPKETRSAAAVDQSQAMSRAIGDDTKIQVKVQVTGKVAANQAYVDASPYNIYTGYTAAAEGSTANGQVGEAAATNALVQTAARTTEAQPQPSVAVMLPPQLQSQQAPAPAPAVRTDAPPIQALEASSNSGATQNNSQSGFASVGGQGQNTQNAAEAKAAQQTATDRPQVTPREIVDQIKVVISRAAKSGLDKVQIQLKPAELGRIDVKLEMSEDHKVRVTVTADNKETLALLQSDSHTLERTLNDAGLRTDSANLHFNLRSESDPREAQNGQQGQNRGANQRNSDTAPEDTAQQFDYAAAARNRGGVDTFA